MKNMEKIISAQVSIIEKLARCESAISELYALYGSEKTELQDFWNGISKKECQHAKLLTGMIKKINEGKIFYNLGRFKDEEISAFHKQINDAIDLAKKHKTEPIDAVKTALSIESSMLDAHFYDIVTSDQADFKIIAQRLSEDTADHVSIVREKLHELRAQQTKK